MRFLDHLAGQQRSERPVLPPRQPAVTMEHVGSFTFLSQRWIVRKPDGSVLNTAGTQTSGLQEAINFAFANGYPLFVFGGPVIKTPVDAVPRLVCAASLSIPTGWGAGYYFYKVDLLYTGAAANDFIVFDSWDFSTFYFDGEIIYTGDAAAIRILPVNDNGEGFTGWTSSHLRIGTIAIVNPSTLAPESTHGIGVRTSPGANAIINNVFEINEVNGGLVQIQIDTPSGGGSFQLNRTVAPACHFSGSAAVVVASGATALIFGNQWHLILAPAAGNGLQTFAQTDYYNIAISGSASIGIQLGSGADQNLFACHRNIATTPLQDNSGATKQNNGLFGWLMPRFSVHRNGTNQTGIVTATTTKVQFTTEIYDFGGVFDAVTNFRWTPGRLGKAHISARVAWVTMTDQSTMNIYIHKNGAVHKQSQLNASGGAAQQGPMIAADVDVTAATDFFEIFVDQNTGGNRDIDGAAQVTWAMGHMID